MPLYWNAPDMIYEFDGYKPVIHETAFVHKTASIIGNVIIGKDVYVGPGAAIRGDWGEIRIEDGCNVQENCVLHMFPGKQVWLKKSAHIGHGAIIHGATVGENCLIGMNAVLMDDVQLGNECIVGALTFIPGEMVVEPRKVIVGNPGKVVKEVSNDMIAWKTKGTELYQQLPSDSYRGLKECEPLREEPKERKRQQTGFDTWKGTNNN